MQDEELSGAVIGCFFTSYNDLEFGLPESHYVRAFDILFREQGISARREHPVDVLFHGERIGTFRLDFLVEDRIVLEVKAGHTLPAGSRAQLLTYLRQSKMKVGLLLFFGPVPEVQRVEL